MDRTAVVSVVATVSPVCTGKKPYDSVLLYHHDQPYFVNTEVGKVKVGQNVNVSASGFMRDGRPTRLTLVN